jgi:hypothetical protein
LIEALVRAWRGCAGLECEGVGDERVLVGLDLFMVVGRCGIEDVSEAAAAREH